MIKFKLNPKEIIPEWKEYIPVLISALLNYFVVLPSLEKIFPIIQNLGPLEETLVLAVLIVYFKNIIDFSLNGREYF